MTRISIVLGITAMAFGSLALADTITFDSPTGNLGATHTYTFDGANIIATEFNGTALFAKNLGVGEQGLGVTADPSKENELFAPGTDFIQLDLSDLLAKGFTNFSFAMNSVQENQKTPDAWSVSACSVSGTNCGASPITGNDQANHAFPAGFSATNHFLDFSATGGNVLISSLTATPTPEPRFYGVLLLGILGLVGLVYRKQRTA